MAKTTPQDSQILLNMMKVQDAINKVLGDSDDDAIVKKSTNVDLLTYYIVKIFAMRKNFSSKTKKKVGFFDDAKAATVLESMSFCYPILSPTEIVSFARFLADEVARDELIKRYNECIADSSKYEDK